ncbi:hypothetical protein MY8738_001422 [Beauveria namnaoensis]
MAAHLGFGRRHPIGAVIRIVCQGSELEENFLYTFYRIKYLAEARAWLRERTQDEIHEVLKDRHPYRGKGGFYAVANGRKVGVFHNWCDCQLQTAEVEGACFKKFETEQEAEAFIQDWKQAVVEVYMVEIKTALDNGFRPAHMKFNVKKKLLPRDTKKAAEPEPAKAKEQETLKGGESLSLEGLGLEDEQKVPAS